MRRPFSILLCTLALLGCGAGPDVDQLRQDLQQRLEKDFASGVLQIETLSRRGQQPFVVDGDGGNHLLVYYKAKLVFQQDHKLSGWDRYNVGSFISLLGATPAGVKGVKPAGNVRGDELLVYGLFAYTEAAAGADAAWRMTRYTPDQVQYEGEQQQSTYVPEVDTEAAPRAGSGTQAYRQLESELREITQALAQDGDAREQAALLADLTNVVLRTRLRHATAQGTTAFVTGPLKGNYNHMGKGIEALVRDAPAFKLKAFSSPGAVENLNLMAGGPATLALTQNDLALMAYNGEAQFTGSRNTALRAVASLYPEAVQIIVRQGADIESVADLAGKRVNLGAQGSGGLANSRQILAAHGIATESFYTWDLPTAAQAFNARQLDALFVTLAYPARFVETLGAAAALIGIDPSVVERLVAQHDLIPVTVPRLTYPGQKAAVHTVGVTALLVTGKDTPNAHIETLLSRLFTGQSELAKFTLQASFVSREKALAGVTIPLHPAAEVFFRQR